MNFWDASALAKGYVQEQGTPSVLGAFKALRGRGFLTEYVALEVLTVLGKHTRERRLSTGGYRTAVAEFFRDFPGAFRLVDVDEGIRRHGFALAQSLRDVRVGALDVLHLASALHVQKLAHPRPVIFAAVDAPLLKAAAGAGLGTFNPEADPLGKLLGMLR